MFIGEFERTVDSRGRVTIPAELRAELEAEVFITRGLDGCLFVYPPSIWEALANKIAELPLARSSVRYFSRMVFSGIKCQLDNQGRILLPAYLRKHAGIESDVVIIGVNSRLEIWGKEKWKEVVLEMKERSDQFAEQLTKLRGEEPFIIPRRL